MYFGGPAALLVFGTVCLEDVLSRRVIAPLKKLGDASYSLYLSHTLVIPLFGWCLGMVGVTALIPRFLTALALCILASTPIYQFIEVPLLRSLRSASGAKPTKIPALKPGEVSRCSRSQSSSATRPSR